MSEIMPPVTSIDGSVRVTLAPVAPTRGTIAYAVYAHQRGSPKGQEAVRLQADGLPLDDATSRCFAALVDAGRSASVALPTIDDAVDLMAAIIGAPRRGAAQ